ncbi:nuclear transport factor 2 family protein [Amycolatopsis pithecellobii]|uniref:Nuclear transport factor 2 family protein n=1 Tax=Amycolatopsis pithecellobii TaxID=664692 RepID=A0A6N7Z861_9PSEU|nr:nuclear transport factor 2 family protein [Amycolatopsis pithecellobii]MTD57570.1 nuclear transport factor 2 family protein [Amycolatopsis pithecellobii]
MDSSEIRAVIEGWAVWRDAGAWEQLRSTWHDDGRMKTTWFRGSADDFVNASRTGFDKGVMVHHFLGGSAIEVSGSRAVAQTKMSISQRLTLDDAEVDVTCVGRFYDFFERRDGAWRIVLREPVYEKDRIDPVTPGRAPRLDHEALAAFPYGCRHLLFCQRKAGMNVYTDVPGLRGPEVEALYANGRDWLDGKPLPAG